MAPSVKLDSEHLAVVFSGSLRGLAWAGRRGAGRVTLPSLLQGYPGSTQGGALATLVWEVARPEIWEGYPASVTLQIERSVEVETPLDLSADREHVSSGLGVTLTRLARPLARARVRWGRGVDVVERTPDDVARLAKTEAPWRTANTVMCLGCGVGNPVGLQIQFQYDDTSMWSLLRPRPPHVWEESQWYPGALFVGLDELAWWLGALRMGEAGVTTQMTITLLAPHPFGEPVFFAGRRADVVSVDPRDRIWQVEAWALSGQGRPLAYADIRFAGGRAYTKRALPSFLEASSREMVQRIFPGAFR